jgi:propanol-preferring alcohol dehydrogenase
MRAMVLESPRAASAAPLREATVGDPQIADDELGLRVVACGVCRTDLQLVEGDLAAHRLPIVPGHQIVGVVEAVGARVTGWKPGDRAGVAWLASTCGTCRYCTQGRENLCARALFTGWDKDGGYASRCTVRAAFALRVPDGFADDAVAPLLCGGVIGYRSLRLSGVQPGGRLGLYGFGASALLAIQVARHWGCEVYVCTRSPSEQVRAKTLGAAWTGSYEDRPPVPLDAAVTFAPSGDVVAAALKSLARGATVAINAIHLDRVPELAYEDLWWERQIRSVANFTRKDAQELLDLASKIPLRTTFETHPLADANIALERLSSGQVEGAAVLVP